MTPRLRGRLAAAVAFALSAHAGLTPSTATAQQPGQQPGVVRPAAPGVPRPGVQVLQPPAGEQGPLPPAMQVPPNAQAPPQVATVPPQPAVAPFVLNPQQQQELNAVLLEWQNRGSKIKTLHCSFYLWETNPTFNDNTQHAGQIKYQYPDRGEYSVDKVAAKAPGGQGIVWQPEDKERWCCNGLSVFQFNKEDTTVVEHQLPASLRGVAIQQSPLPFLFSANAEHLNRRYFMRIVTKPEDKAKGHIWLEAYPRFQQDAANFKRAELILTTNDFLPYGMKLTLPDGGAQGREHEKSYLFVDYKVNPDAGFFAKLIGARKIGDPEIPAGWKTKVEPATEPATTQPAAQAPKPLSIFRSK